jgi:hypothetical protein
MGVIAGTALRPPHGGGGQARWPGTHSHIRFDSEPSEAGIVPVSWLSRRYLHTHPRGVRAHRRCQHSTQATAQPVLQRRRRKASALGAHKPLRFDSEPSQSGIEPVSWLYVRILRKHTRHGIRRSGQVISSPHAGKSGRNVAHAWASPLSAGAPPSDMTHRWPCGQAAAACQLAHGND